MKTTASTSEEEASRKDISNKPRTNLRLVSTKDSRTLMPAAQVDTNRLQRTESRLLQLPKLSRRTKTRDGAMMTSFQIN